MRLGHHAMIKNDSKIEAENRAMLGHQAMHKNDSTVEVENRAMLFLLASLYAGTTMLNVGPNLVRKNQSGTHARAVSTTH